MKESFGKAVKPVDNTRMMAKKQAQVIKVKRSNDDWKKMISEAKRKETFWSKGVMQGHGDLVGADEMSNMA